MSFCYPIAIRLVSVCYPFAIPSSAILLPTVLGFQVRIISPNPRERNKDKLINWNDLSELSNHPWFVRRICPSISFWVSSSAECVPDVCVCCLQTDCIFQVDRHVRTLTHIISLTKDKIQNSCSIRFRLRIFRRGYKHKVCFNVIVRSVSTWTIIWEHPFKGIKSRKSRKIFVPRN